MEFLKARKAAGLTQAFVAQQLDVSPAAISQWEKGLTAPRASLLPKVAKLYGVTIDQLIANNE